MTWQTIKEKYSLEISEVLVSELGNELRIEAEFYTSNSSSNGSFCGEDIISFVQYGTSEALNENNSGFPVLRLNEFELAFSGTPSKYSDAIDQDGFEKLKLKKGDVLICRTNGNPKYVGKSAVVMQDTEYAFASYLFRIRPNDKINSATLVSYLNSKTGREEIEKYSIVSNQANFSPAKFRQISIPVIPTKLQTRIENIFEKSWELYSSSMNFSIEAESLLLKEFSLNRYVENELSISVRGIVDCLRDDRFDAEYWQPKYDAMEKAVSKVPQKELGEIVSISKGVEVGSEAYDTEGKPFIRVSDFSIYGIEDVEKKISPELYEELKDKYTPKKGEVLFTKDGTIGLSYALHEDVTGILSGAFLRLKPTVKINADYLALVLNSLYCKTQIERMSGGAIIAHLKPDSVKKIKIPLLSDAKQTEIADKVSTAFRMRKEAQELLEKAKRSVEIFIEKDEEEALKMLNK